jgi:hypothetical protein
VRVRVDVTAPSWAPVDTVEIFANNTFDVPAPKGMQPQPLVPVLCFTSRMTPSARCQQAVGGARMLMTRLVRVGNGPNAPERFEASVDVVLDAAEVAARTRMGAQGRDFWLLARAFGNVGLFPVVPVLDEAVPTSELVENLQLDGRGIPALAFTNAVFVDVDGNGYKAPFAP